ncbi:long-chain fatty acid--CoA ligase [Streptomyces sp. NPDC051453]|uniref:acyl-CoA synthetase n=1 Tax=Streptomyces sp. NPDC051453 TaxID=3154941 RepID=UPI003430F121
MHLTQFLHRALQQDPDRPMTACGERVRTTRDVVGRIGRLAGGLRGLGVEEGDRVAILALNSDRYHEAFFASWWLGAAITPVNIRWSAAEIAYAISDAGARVLLVDDTFEALVPELRDRCPELRTLVHCGEEAPPEGMTGYERLIEDSTAVEDLRIGGDALAAVLYTGGTTGFPKGVMVTHRGLVTSTMGTQAVNRSAIPGGVALVGAPMFHIAAIAGWMQQICVGGTAVFLPAFTPVAVFEAVQRHRVTSMGMVPTMLQMLVDHAGADQYELESVQTIGYGASPVSATLLERAMRRFPRAGFVQGYGMTETAMICVLGREEHRKGGRLLRSAGRATPHCEVRIAGLDGQELPRGEIGELTARGDNVMPGYWNLPEQSAEALRDGWMYTGDAAYMDDEGYVFVVDRLKDMIITGGENVYSTEVENALAAHPAVASCAVVGLSDDKWGERVHAEVVLKPGAAATDEELRAHVRSLIAGYKVPRSITITDALPVSAAGKILKRDLRKRYEADAEPRS